MQPLRTGQDLSSQQLGWPRTVIDGTVLPDYIVKAVASGGAKGIPVLMGITRDELSATYADPTISGYIRISQRAQIPYISIFYGLN